MITSTVKRVFVITLVLIDSKIFKVVIIITDTLYTASTKNLYNSRYVHGVVQKFPNFH